MEIIAQEFFRVRCQPQCSLSGGAKAERLFTTIEGFGEGAGPLHLGLSKGRNLEPGSSVHPTVPPGLRDKPFNPEGDLLVYHGRLCP